MDREDIISINKDYMLIEEYEFHEIQEQVIMAHKMLVDKTGPGSEFTGWMDYPSKYPKDEFERISDTAKKIREMCDVFIVIGIGGSYLGSRAVIDALSSNFKLLEDRKQRNSPLILYLGVNTNSNYIGEMIENIKDKDICINLISKSGKTIEPSLSFRILRDLLEKKYGDDARDRIFITTSRRESAIGDIADDLGYEKFYIPDDIGGRFSVLTPVGMLPVAVAGIDIYEILRGARVVMDKYSSPQIEENDCYRYAAYRNILDRKGKDIELMAAYEPKLFYFQEWWKQLFGESEGKDRKGIFPVAIKYTTDLHSLGQYVQDGKNILFQTTLNLEKSAIELKLPENRSNDGLTYLDNQSMEFVESGIMNGVLLAHKEGEVPGLVINIPELTPYYMGQLIYFFEKACAISGYLLGVNPFNQPGVELYKKEMVKILKEINNDVI